MCLFFRCWTKISYDKSQYRYRYKNIGKYSDIYRKYFRYRSLDTVYIYRISYRNVFRNDFHRHSLYMPVESFDCPFPLCCYFPFGIYIDLAVYIINNRSLSVVILLRSFTSLCPFAPSSCSASYTFFHSFLCSCLCWRFFLSLL